jgi:Ca2+-binding RTX toxin-like protein
MIERARSANRTRRLTELMVLVFVVATPSVAEASVATRTGAQVSVTAAPGEANVIRLAVGSNDVRVSDTVGITAGDGCLQESATQVTCGAGEPDLVTVQLGDGNDQFITDAIVSARAYNIDGGPGNDKIDGGLGPDVIHGGPGNDTILGSGGDDQLYGDEGDDSVKGQKGDDQVSGGPGRDLVEGDDTQGYYGDGGSDVIDSRDGQVDQVTCGFGADRVTADTTDVIESGGLCESVDAAAGVDPAPEIVGAPPQPGASFGVALGARTSVKMSKLLSKNGFPFALAVNAPCRGTGTLVVAAAEARRRGLGKSSVTLASDTFAVPDAGTYAAGVTVKPKFRKKLKALKQLATTLSFSCVASGVTKSKSQKVTFRR